ncbi:hypothetical protein GCM10025857_07920 [Alicyclobacillus contaminans]|uniref:HD domain-containing protein n=1 Tax=Alicyclobacillus contaminans TaxID=392016 RepID=UPI0003FEFAEE|nr:HD domain-containing protein [Alicyclobacillus contaminans]GMA49435.1 hypothetical protein GCM10025857_07920 [Alicyclobacillus contaminans]
MAWFEKVLKDPVHDEILVDDPWIWRLVNTAAVQRLRRIRQLGTSYLTFHGAEHSRFTHSLGAYETMRRVLHYLQREYGWPADLRERRLALSAALLHDVGHGPFSHTFERIYPVHHEQWTQRILMEDDELASVLAEIDDTFASELAGVLRKDGRHPYIQQLITSQLDVDRMDYLLRDALHTGVSYGRFELARLIRSLALHEGTVVLKQSGLHTAEQYILARYFMYTQVYLHPVTMGSDLLVAQILRRADELWKSGQSVDMPHELVALFEGQDAVTVREYLAVDESTLQYAFHSWARSSDPVLRDLAQRFLERKLFAPIIRSEPSSEEWAVLRTAARAMGFHPDYYVCGRGSEVSAYVYQGQGIFVLSGGGSVQELSRVSKVVRSLNPDAEYCLVLPKEMLETEGPFQHRVRSVVSGGAPVSG